MVIAAHFALPTEQTDTRRKPRRQLQLAAMGALTTGESTAVTIHNISATGILLETQTALAEAERIDINLPDAGPVSARVIWVSENFYGCRFDAELPLGVLSSLELRSPAPTPMPPPLSATGEGFAERLRQLRKTSGMTLAAIADQLGVSKPTVWAWEQGRARPTPERLSALASRFGLSEAELVRGHNSGAMQGVLQTARRQIAEAFGTDISKVRIMIEL